MDILSVQNDAGDYGHTPDLFEFSSSSVTFETIVPTPGLQVGFSGMAYRSTFFAGADSAENCEDLGYRLDYFITGRAAVGGDDVVQVPVYIAPANIVGGFNSFDISNSPRTKNRSA